MQAFINSNYDLEHVHGADLFASPADLQRWLARRDLVEEDCSVTRRDRVRALVVRDGLRALLVAKHGERDQAPIDALNGHASQLPSTVQLDPQHPHFAAAERTAAGALGLILSLTAAAMLDGTWSRLKACRECRWAFYDHSRNAAGSWCSMAVCGGRAKQRAYYARHTRS